MFDILHLIMLDILNIFLAKERLPFLKLTNFCGDLGQGQGERVEGLNSKH